MTKDSVSKSDYVLSYSPVSLVFAAMEKQFLCVTE